MSHVPFRFVLLRILALLCLAALASSELRESPSFSPVDQRDDKRGALTTYIVHVDPTVAGEQEDDLDKLYESFLPVQLSGTEGRRRVVYSYRHVISGFAARLTRDEALAVSLQEGVVMVQEEMVYSLHTTHSLSFLGLVQGSPIWRDSNLGKGIIIGVLDTGITPGHPSFNDEGVPPPPEKWKGRCDFNSTACNNKLIGARDFLNLSNGSRPAEPPLDGDGHGTHTSSTAGGNFVQGANVLGNANGTAAGVAPLAHVAVYRVCNDSGCFISAILAAMDAAIDDGVDLLSLSLGGGSIPFYLDSIAVAAFRATQRGIFVSCSAANAGPENTTLSNEAPWILTVGASTIDRRIVSDVKLGNSEEYSGESVYQPKDFPSTMIPLVFPGSNGNDSAALCLAGSLSSSDVKGKVVLCERGVIARVDKGKEVKEAGGAAMILMNDEINAYSILADAHVLPASHISYAAGMKIKEYINSSSTPTASVLFKGTVIGNKDAPAITSFSSRGPSFQSPGILKPDITGPGVNILAAWPYPLDNATKTDLTFNMISGTSMSCPHLSGVAALLKSSHPTWSPAAIKSAIMTTAYVLNLDGEAIIDETSLPANIFAFGAGHVDPPKADDPGLIYDLTPEDYIPYLCGLGYSDAQVKLIVRQSVNCSNATAIPESQLNYPSFSILLGSTTQNYSRTVMNVGPPNSSYTYKVDAPEGVDVTIYPSVLSFAESIRTATYTVEFRKSPGKAVTKPFSQGSLTWSYDKYTVRSPIAILFN
ncbi:hypothetical protein MLD38_016552 [Melastoma candidum]|uniref:Uncharacterized protein n=1 Tax=Melastoma candidum TaxID=119954 RepID=A0ACB9QMS0_9MYRT|nr:hypothetical protein MLD38_016552 [Melastoma candidum]